MSKSYKFTNKEISSILKEVLSAMEVKNYNIFKIRAYQTVISVIDSLTRSVYNMWENEKLEEITGVGSALQSHLEELFKTGKVAEFDVIKRDLPEGMFELIGLRGIGAKRAYKLAQAFDLSSRETALEKIKTAADEHKIQELDGFGEKIELQILDSISELKKTKHEKQRILLENAEQVSGRIISYLKGHPEISDAIALGSFRRRAPTIGDLDIAIKTANPEIAINHFLKFSEIEEILVSGDKRASVVVGNDLQVDIRVTTDEDFGSMLQYFTGSKAHNVNLRTFALEKGLSLSEYGIKQKGELHKFGNEEDFYKFIGLQYVPSELREGRNEVDLASQNKLPELVKLSDIQGDLHTHTVYSDGENTLHEMVSRAQELGYKYIGISDHTPSITNRGFSEVEKVIETTKNQIEKLNSSLSGIKVLYGFEVNILADATLSLPDELLKELDYAVAAIHTSFNQTSEEITKRLIMAAENPYINILGHPTGRLINERPSFDIDWRSFFSAVKANNKIIEINGQPNRMDLPEELVYEAVTRGIDLIIDSDAHSTQQFDNMRFGIDVARRGWCTKANITNTLSLEELLKKLSSSRAR